MSRYSTLIDPAEFGLIADYLRAPRAPILHLLYVRSKELLAPLAEQLDRVDCRRTPPWLFPAPVERGLRNGSLRISSCTSVDGFDSSLVVDATRISRHALCHVIFAPPFYLVHARGLFEGTLIQPLAASVNRSRGPRAKR